MTYLPSDKAGYLVARKYFSRLLERGGPPEDMKMARLAREACRFAYLRLENRFLMAKHLPDMDLEPVFFAANAYTGGLSGGGFIDAEHGAVIVLDSISRELKYHSIDWRDCGSRLRFPPDGKDLRDIYR